MAQDRVNFSVVRAALRQRGRGSYGKLSVSTMPRQFVFKLRDEYATAPAMTRTKPPVPILDDNGVPTVLQTPRRANHIVDVLRLLMSWAENRGGWLKGPNPVIRPGRLRTNREGSACGRPQTSTRSCPAQTCQSH